MVHLNRVMQFSYGQEGSAMSQETPIPPNTLCPIILFLQNKGGKETTAGPRLGYSVLNGRKGRKWFLVT